VSAAPPRHLERKLSVKYSIVWGTELSGSGSAVSSLVPNFQGLGDNLCGREARVGRGGGEGGTHVGRRDGEREKTPGGILDHRARRDSEIT